MRKSGYTVDGVPYRVYVRSDAWAAVKARYRKSKLPQKCVVCQSAVVDIHHKTYDRLGAERLTDLVPLCRKHHDRVHERVGEGTASIHNGPKRVRLAAARARKRQKRKKP